MAPTRCTSFVLTAGLPVIKFIAIFSTGKQMKKYLQQLLTNEKMTGKKVTCCYFF
jgi:hypothetical protein